MRDHVLESALQVLSSLETLKSLFIILVIWDTQNGQGRNTGLSKIGFLHNQFLRFILAYLKRKNFKTFSPLFGI